MKNCPYCGAQLEDSAGFCYYCMKKLAPEEKTFALPKKKWKALPIIIAAAVAVAMIGGVFAAIALGRRTPEAPIPPETSESIEESVEPTEPSEPTEAPANENGDGPFALMASAEPTETPIEPTETPVEPTETPIEPTETPVEPTETPIEPTETPVEPTETPVEPTETPAHIHVQVEDKGYPATCLEDGLSDGSHCAVCGEVLVEQTVLPATGHTPVIDKGYSVSCLNDGLTDGAHCSVCGEVLINQIVIPMIDHSPVIYETVYPTCTEDGLSEGRYCSVCGEVLVEQTVLPAMGHDYEITVYPATGESDGYTEYCCRTCGDYFIIPNEEDDPTETPTDPTETPIEPTETPIEPTETPVHTHTPVCIPAVEPTCTETGLSEGSRCETCGEVLVEQTILPALGHDWSIPEPAIPSTCQEGGLTSGRLCSRCWLSSQEPTPRLNHDPYYDDNADAYFCSFCNQHVTVEEIKSSFEEWQWKLILRPKDR